MPIHVKYVHVYVNVKRETVDPIQISPTHRISVVNSKHTREQ